jgi:hypothetical protein
VSRGAWLLAAALGVGCGPLDARPVVTPPELDPATFARDVQPMYGRLCAQSACHGDPARSFSLYHPGSLRIDDDWRRPTLSDAELAANLEASRLELVGLEDLLESRLLTKPLRVAAGGTTHGGGEQFFDRGDPDFVILACWLLGGAEDCTR